MRPSRVATAPRSTMPSPAPAMVASRAFFHSRSTAMRPCTNLLRSYCLDKRLWAGSRMGKLHFATALVPGGWHDEVLVTVANGVIAAVETGVETGDATRFSGAAVPGLPNLHSHTFQRGMAGGGPRPRAAARNLLSPRRGMLPLPPPLPPPANPADAALPLLSTVQGRG